MIAELDNLTRTLVGTGNVPLVNRLREAAFPLRYLYGNITEKTQGYFLDDSADDVRNFELPRLGKNDCDNMFSILSSGREKRIHIFLIVVI